MITADLAAVLGKVRRPGDFFAAGTTELLAPLLEVEGVGPVALPLLPIQASELIAVAEPAPYGRGEQTVIDPAVRRCWQIGPDRVRIRGRHWARTLETILARVAEGLGVDAPITAEFYKLLLYDEGSFFIGHRDTEKAPGMFATLVVALPSSFAGGELVVRHKGREVRLDLRCDDPAEAAFAAFYADCVHEVLPVTKGYRLTLVYNLVRQRPGPTPEPPDYAGEQARVAALLQAWRHATRHPGDATAREAGLSAGARLHAGRARVRGPEGRRCRRSRRAHRSRAAGALRPASGAAHDRGERRRRIFRELRIAPGTMGARGRGGRVRGR